MNPKYWQKIRLIILGCCSLGIVGTLGTKLLTKSSSYTFPENITLATWQSINTNKIKYYGTTLQGKNHKKTIFGNNFNVDIYYIPNSLIGNQELIRQYQELESVPQNITVIKNSNIGYYGLLTQNNQSNLNTCIHPQGQTAFTHQQLSNLANHNLKKRLLPWVLGISDLRDWRCFWVNMSVSLDHITQEEAYNILYIELLNLIPKFTQ